MIFQIIAILTTTGVAFACGVQLGRLIEIKKRKKLITKTVEETVSAFDEYTRELDFWLDKHALGRNIN